LCACIHACMHVHMYVMQHSQVARALAC